MDWSKVVKELDRLAEDQYEESMRPSMSMYLSREEMARDKQKARDLGFIFRSFANALRLGID